MPISSDRVRHPEKQHRPDNPIQRKPAWIRVKAPVSREYQDLRGLMRRLNLNTVCEEAACPNIGECWSKGHATVMILGSVCTRACAFCNVATGRPDQLDPHEPDHVAEACEKLRLKHIVITSVDRDDLDDGGAEHFARVIRAVRERSPGTTIEVLTPDFMRKPDAAEIVVEARPQPRDRAAALPAHPTGRAILHIAGPSGSGQGVGPVDVHQIRSDGGPRRRQR